MRQYLFAFVFLLFAVSLTPADEKLKGIACRSVHLGYPAPESIAFYNEVTIEKSSEGTYFMACGWDKGYFGIQELSKGKKVVIFSVWDPGSQNNPNSVDKDQQVKMLHQGEGVRVGRFGNEGTGGQSFFDYDWKVGETYRFFVTAVPDQKRTTFAGYFWLPEKKEWKHLVTFSTITGGSRLNGLYSFVEDFKRNKVSATIERRATFTNGWVFTKDGKGVSLEKARFTADSNPVLNIDAGAKDGKFYLATGGEITNGGTKLRDSMTRPAGNAEFPEGVEKLIPTEKK